ncbi:MAG: MCE family protein [Calothrix sp. C42_A2020_038]|nr:MCE family protein [Calothrix sp. C42_A2020_038]
MRSLRTVREGTVGLLFLAGIAVFGLIFLWLNRYSTGQNKYTVFVDFTNAGGMQRGAPVRFRGVKVGRISAIRPGPNNVEVELEISQPDLVIPRDVKVEANQSGLIAESLIDITPLSKIPEGAIAGKPLEKNCDNKQIVCNNSRLEGQIGVNVDEVLRSTTELANRYTNEQFYQNLNRTLEQGALAAANVAELSKSLTALSKTAQYQLNTTSGVTTSVQRAANQVSASTAQLSATADKTLNQFGSTANQFGTTASELRSTANQANRLLSNLDSLVTTNRSSLVATLNNISASSNQLRLAANNLSPAINRLTQGEIIKNFETLSANAAQASANLRDASQNLTDPKNAVILQQTLDSARVTFENTQKITSDLDELTGDPKFRSNLRQLVNGLSSLVSSTQEVEQQVQVARTLEMMKNTQAKIQVPAPTNTFTTFKENQIFPVLEISPVSEAKETLQRKQALNRLTRVLKQNSESARLAQDYKIKNLKGDTIIKK